MNITLKLLLAFLCLMLAVAGCETSRHGEISHALHLSQEYNRKAQTEHEKGNHEIALRYYGEALRLSRNQNDHDSIAENLVDMARTYRALDRREQACRAADEVLYSPRNRYVIKRHSDAASIKALLYADEGKYDEALEWADKALSFCDASCYGQRIFGIKARIYFLMGEYIQALNYGTRGLWMSRKIKDRHEESNMLRVMAEARAALDEPGEAQRLYKKALSIDEELGLSRDIALDLRGLGRVLQKQGRASEAMNCFLRALLVSEADRDEEGIKEASSLMEQMENTE